MSAMTAEQPGWAGPRGGPIHWWNSEGRKACDPEDLTRYLGDKLPDVDVTVARVCLDCADLARRVR